MAHPLRLSLVPLLLLSGCARPPETGRVTGGLDDMLLRYLTEMAEKQLAERAAKIAAIQTPADVASRQEYARGRILASFGGFPKEKTPLRARVTGSIQRDAYKIEKLIYESLPGLFVTANVYVPLGAAPPFPAVLVTTGHGFAGKASSTTQQVSASLATRGILALAYDPIGQGERLEYFSAEQGKSLAGRGPTMEHMMADWQCRLTGGNFARYEIWDGIRGVDYLLERGDVDPARIGVTGNSGGGTQSAYLAAMEPRLAAAHSVCYITNWKTLWNGPGPQDAEQSLTHFLSDGLDFGDFTILFAPRPFNITAGTLDYFPIEGARETAAETRRIYEVLGKAEAARFLESPGPHGYLKGRREETYRWMERWLKGRGDEPAVEGDIHIAPENELWSTATGQVSMSVQSTTVNVLNRAVAEEQFAGRTLLKDPAQARPAISRRLGVTLELGKQREAPAARAAGTLQRDGYRIETAVVETEPGISVPTLLLIPDAGAVRKPAVIYLNPSGKSAGMTAGEGRDEASRWDPLALVEAGHVVMVPDLRGWGESAPRHHNNPGSSGYSVEYQTSMRALLVGKTVAGMQVGDLLRCFDYLIARPDVDASRVAVFGKADGGVLALYAAALEPRIGKVVSEGALLSYMAMIRAKFHQDMERIVVPGVLQDFDLPDLAAAIAPRPVWIMEPLTPTKVPVPLREAAAEYEPARKAFAQAGHPERLHFGRRLTGVTFEKHYGAWLGTWR
ncbi:MAG: acetylxylan esterase [Bryobacterales bacterium]|nr:acetylxylan esterase [Bryobacterales bacterium]